jgi:hypothetical protein
LLDIANKLRKEDSVPHYIFLKKSSTEKVKEMIKERNKDNIHKIPVNINEENTTSTEECDDEKEELIL